MSKAELWERVRNIGRAPNRPAESAAPRFSRSLLTVCEHLGDRLPDQPCGSALHRCNLHGGLTVRFGSCLDAERSCSTCDDHPSKRRPRPAEALPVSVSVSDSPVSPSSVVRLPVAADGIGDHLVALSLAAGWKNANPDGTLWFEAKALARPWVALFGGYDHFGVPPGGAPAVHNLAKRSGRHYVDVASKSGPRAMPPVKPLPADATAWAERYRGSVVLCPRAAHAARNWHRSHWLALETILAGRGISTVLVGSAGDRDALQGFRSPAHCGESAARVAALLTVAAATVANESGLAHLAGALGRPVVVLAAQLPGADVHGFWPRSVQLQGPLACSGCRWTGPNFRAACNTVCASLQAIEPATVADAVGPYVVGTARPRLSTAHPLDVIRAAGEFPADEMAALFSARDRHENLAEWLARYAKLFDVVKELAPRRVVEIGVRAGYSSWALCRAAPSATVLAYDLNVDPSKGNSHGGYLNAWEHARAINAGHNWHLALCDSHALDRLPAADLVFIDGDHTREGCTADLELAERSGAGAILLDDYATADLDVRVACDAFLSARPNLHGEFIDNGSTGLFLIRPRGER